MAQIDIFHNTVYAKEQDLHCNKLTMKGIDLEFTELTHEMEAKQTQM